MGGGTRGVGEGTQRWARSAWEHPRVGEGTGRDRAAPAEEVRGEGGRDVRQVWKSWSAQFWGETPPQNPAPGGWVGAGGATKTFWQPKNPPCPQQRPQ